MHWGRTHLWWRGTNIAINPELLSFKAFLPEGPEPLYYVCLSVRLSHLRSAESAERTSNKKISSVPRILYVFNCERFSVNLDSSRIMDGNVNMDRSWNHFISPASFPLLINQHAWKAPQSGNLVICLRPILIARSLCTSHLNKKMKTMKTNNFFFNYETEILNMKLIGIKINKIIFHSKPDKKQHAEK